MNEVTKSGKTIKNISKMHKRMHPLSVIMLKKKMQLLLLARPEKCLFAVTGGKTGLVGRSLFFLLLPLFLFLLFNTHMVQGTYLPVIFFLMKIDEIVKIMGQSNYIFFFFSDFERKIVGYVFSRVGWVTAN